MQYPRFGRSDFRPSALGFGCMRLPTLGDFNNVDEPEAIRLIRRAIDAGVNYVDTAYPYHGGNSERVLGLALGDGYRERVKVATKLPVRLAQTYADFDRIFGEQLAKLQTDRVDFYLLHGLRLDGYRRVRDLGVLEWAEGARREGRIGELGFSFHDTYDAFESIVDDYDWSFCQVQYNYLDVDIQAGSKGVRYAAAKGLGVVVMEPLLGGRLADPPAAVNAVLQRAEKKRTPAEWALQWLWSQPEISLLLSGMNASTQVDENVASAGRSGVGLLSEEELRLVAEARDTYNALYPVPCTQCRYCMPCTNGVDIPANLLNFNRAIALDQMPVARQRYNVFMDVGARASACIQCRECEERCPQSIPISDWMAYSDAILGQNQPHDPARAPARVR